jgi:hypothetical protein
MNNYHVQMPPLLPTDTFPQYETKPTLNTVDGIDFTDNDFKSSDIIGKKTGRTHPDFVERAPQSNGGENVQDRFARARTNPEQNTPKDTQSRVPPNTKAPTEKQPPNSRAEPQQNTGVANSARIEPRRDTLGERIELPRNSAGENLPKHPEQNHGTKGGKVDPNAAAINAKISKLTKPNKSPKGAQKKTPQVQSEKKVNPAVYQYIVIPIFLFIVFIVLVYPKTSNLFSKWLGPIETSKGLLYRAGLLSLLYVIFTTSLKAFAK